jgi:phage tail sheath protein FI
MAVKKEDGMPVTPTYPGVYIEEVPSGVRTITGVATSVTAFIGRAARGPLDEPVTVNSYADFEREFGGLWPLGNLSFAVRDFFLNGGGQAIAVRVINGGSKAPVTLPAPAAEHLDLEAANPGAWGNKLKATADHDTKVVNNFLFNLTVTDGGLGQEKFLNLSVQSADPRYAPKVLEQNSKLVRVAKDGGGNWIVPGQKPNAGTATAVEAADRDGSVLTSTEVTGTASAKTGLYALEKVDLFNILCIPPYKVDGNVDSGVMTAAATYCEEKRAFLIVDPLAAWDDKSDPKVDFASVLGTNSRNAALFFPRLMQPNQFSDNREEQFAPCGAVAGIFARTDAERGVWKAPAGLDAVLRGVPKLSVSLTDKENGELNPLGVNCLRFMAGAGFVVWGGRTMQGADRLASEWKYIPVRRTALFLEESLYRGTQWVVFEPNDEPLWAQIRLNVGAFMHSLFRKGAFAGTTPREAYFVKCDKETTTATDVNQGIVNILVGFAPLKPAEFVIIRIQQIAGQTTA